MPITVTCLDWIFIPTSMWQPAEVLLWNQLPWLAQTPHAAAGRVPWQPFRLDDFWFCKWRLWSQTNTKKWSFCHNRAVFLEAVKICVEFQAAASSCISAMRSGTIMIHPLHTVSLLSSALLDKQKTACFSLHRNLREMSVIYFGKVLFYLTGANKPIVAGWLLPIISTLLA